MKNAVISLLQNTNRQKEKERTAKMDQKPLNRSGVEKFKDNPKKEKEKQNRYCIEKLTLFILSILNFAQVSIFLLQWRPISQKN